MYTKAIILTLNLGCISKLGGLLGVALCTCYKCCKSITCSRFCRKQKDDRGGKKGNIIKSRKMGHFIYLDLGRG